MIALETLKDIGDSILVGFFCVVLLGGIALSFKTRFIQLRMIPRMMKLLFGSIFKKNAENSVHGVIPSYKALFTAMSTTLGIGNIVGPAVAMRLGGPGALLGFLVALFFGSALTFAEVTCALTYRKKLSDGSFAGGPMQYINKYLGKAYAIIYACAGALLLVIWSGHQSNSLSDIIANYSIPRPVTGIVITALVMFYLIAGIKKIGTLASKIVPLMFVMYCGACLIVIFCNLDKVFPSLLLIITSAFSVKAVSGATVGLSIQKMLRWGLAKGAHAGEAGLGTATIPHSQAITQSPQEQGILSMVSLYSVALVGLLTGLALLVTGVWQDPNVPLGVNMVDYAFSQYIPVSSFFFACSVFLFALGTILGNAYNGSQCFLYVTNNRWLSGYHLIVAIMVFIGTMVDVEFIWSISDYFIIPVVLPNFIAVMLFSYKRSNLLKI